MKSNTPFYEVKNMISRLSRDAVRVYGEGSAQVELIRMVEAVLMTEFGGRSDDPDFIELALVGIEAVPKALRTYKPTKGTRVGTWGWLLIKHAMMNYLARRDNMERREVAWLGEWATEDATEFNWDGDAEIFQSLEDDRGYYVEPTGAGERAMIWKAEYDKLHAKLSPRGQIILDMLLAGETQEAIGERLGISQSRVARLIAKMTTKIRSLLEIESSGKAWGQA